MEKKNICFLLGNIILGLACSHLYMEKNDLVFAVEEILEEKESWVSAYERLSDTFNSLNATYTFLKEKYTSLSANYSFLQEEYGHLEASNRDLNQMLIELEDSLNFTNFKTLEELQNWLASDYTDKHEYVPEQYDCDDFAYDLMISAFESGYIVETICVHRGTVVSMYHSNDDWYNTEMISKVYSEGTGWINTFGNHMMNLAYVEEVGWVLIEPQTDQVVLLDTHEL